MYKNTNHKLSELLAYPDAYNHNMLQGVSKPFNDVIKANIGDAHAMGQAPVVFLRQVLGLVVNPDGMKDPSIPSDAKERAAAILAGCKVYLLKIHCNATNDGK